MALLARHETELDGLDVEAILKYAEFMALHPGRLWQDADVAQNARLQTIMLQRASPGTERH